MAVVRCDDELPIFAREVRPIRNCRQHLPDSRIGLFDRRLVARARTAARVARGVHIVERDEVGVVVRHRVAERAAGRRRGTVARVVAVKRKVVGRVGVRLHGIQNDRVDRIPIDERCRLDAGSAARSVPKYTGLLV